MLQVRPTWVLWPRFYDGVSKGKTARTFSSWRPRARALSPQPHRSASPECQIAQQPLQCQESPSRSLSGPWSAVWWHHCANDPVWELLHGAPWLGKMEVVDIQLEGHCWRGPLTPHSVYFVDILQFAKMFRQIACHLKQAWLFIDWQIRNILHIHYVLVEKETMFMWTAYIW